MLRTVRNLLKGVVDDIDAGNSSLTDEEALKVAEALRGLTDREVRMSKYQACRYLGMGRATFDGHVRRGELPRGEKQAGFKELSWTKKSLDSYLARMKKA